MQDNEKYAALVGDVIASRHAEDREHLQSKLEYVMADVAGQIPAVQPLMMTIGDEFQGLFDEVTDAVRASLRIRVGLKGRADVRIGIGWGSLDLVSKHPPFGQDGPCWWRAREAIGDVKKAESSNLVPRTSRTLAHTEEDGEGLLNAYLVARDAIVAGWDETDALIARRLMDDVNQATIADEIGLSQSSVSRRVQNHGILSVLGYEPGR